MTPTVVVFEPAGVLFHYHPERRLEAFAEACGMATTHVRRALFDSGFMADCDTGRVKPRNLVDAMNTQLSCRLGRSVIEACFSRAFEPNNATIAWAKSLQPECQLAILGNGHDVSRSALESFRDSDGVVVDHFRPVLFSADIGARKPSPKVFHALSRLLDQPAERVLIVDTDIASLTIAESMGYQCHHFIDTKSLDRFWAALLS